MLARSSHASGKRISRVTGAQQFYYLPRKEEKSWGEEKKGAVAGSCIPGKSKQTTFRERIYFRVLVSFREILAFQRTKVFFSEQFLGPPTKEVTCTPE